MPEVRQPVPVINWTAVGQKISRYDTLMQVNENNKIQHDMAKKNIDQIKHDRDLLKSTINRCTEIYKDVLKNLDDKKKVSLQEFQDAIDEAASIVTDSDMAGVRLHVNGDDVTLCTQNGHNVNKREGGAQRAVLGQMLRYVAMTQQLNVVPLLLLDESFFALSDNTSVIMRDYLLAMSEHLLIIGIEQNDTLFAGIEKKRRFIFSKNDKTTEVKEV